MQLPKAYLHLLLLLSTTGLSLVDARRKKPNRTISATLSATGAAYIQDPVCEGFSYFSRNGKQWDFLDAISRNPSEFNVDDVLKASRDIGQTDTEVKLLDLALELRQYGKVCARIHNTAVQEYRSNKPESLEDNSIPATFAIARSACAPDEAILLSSLDEFKLFLNEAQSTSCDKKVDMKNILHKNYMGKILFSNKEPTLPSRLDQVVKYVAIIYGELAGDKGWVDVLDEKGFNDVGILVRPTKLSRENTCTFDGNANLNESCTDSTQTYLSTYEVQLKVKEGESEEYDTDSHALMVDFLDGLKMSVFAERSGLIEDASWQSDTMLEMEYMTSNSKSSLTDVIPPLDELFDLSMQSVVVASSAKDVLKKIEDISHNLPSRINHIAGIEVSEKFMNESLKAYHQILPLSNDGEDPVAHLYVNGKAASITRNDFTVFDLIDFFRDEVERLNSLNSLNAINIIPPKFRQFFIDEFEGGDDYLLGKGVSSRNAYVPLRGDEQYLLYRFDVMGGSDDAGIINFNDIEKDDVFSSWNPSIIDMYNEGMDFEKAFEGCKCTIRRNMLNVLIVMDPFSPDSDKNGGKAMTFFVIRLLRKYSVKIDFLFVSEKDIEDYEKLGVAWDLPGSVDDPHQVYIDAAELTSSYKKATGFMSNEDALTRINLLGVFYSNLQTFREEYPEYDTPKELWLQVASKYLASKSSDGKTESDYETILSNEMIASNLEAREQYKRSVKFASDKGIRPGQTFLNGVLVKYNETFSFEKAAERDVMEEQQLHLIDIMDGRLNEETESIYDLYLNNNIKVLGKFHPDYETYIEGAAYASELPNDLSDPTYSCGSDSDIVFRVDAFLDPDSEIGKNTLRSLGVIGNSNGILIGNERFGCQVYLRAIDEAFPYENTVIINGRIFNIPQDAGFSKSDIEFFMSLELRRARGLARIFYSIEKESGIMFDKKELQESITDLACVTTKIFEKEGRKQVANYLLSTDFTPGYLHNKWNDHSSIEHGVLKVASIVDPTSTSTQRLVSYLLLIRDRLGLSLDVILMPNAKPTPRVMPTNTYYRVVMPSQGGLKAGFKNLPDRHRFEATITSPVWNIEGDNNVDILPREKGCDESCAHPIDIEFHAS